jgi:hypothetical protein
MTAAPASSPAASYEATNSQASVQALDWEYEDTGTHQQLNDMSRRNAHAD